MTLTDILSRARCLLIDFDGPICSVFAEYPAAAVAAQLQALIRDRLGKVPVSISELSSNPLQILSQVAELDDDELTRAVADACRDAEVKAVESATPTLGAGRLLCVGAEMGLPAVVVSNNASQAVETYIHRHGIDGYINGIVGRRDGMNPRFLKPHPYLLEVGLTRAGTSAADAVFIGDSETDIEAGRSAGIVSIGYANKLGKRQRLVNAGAAAVIDSMLDLADTLSPVTTRQ